MSNEARRSGPEPRVLAWVLATLAMGTLAAAQACSSASDAPGGPSPITSPNLTPSGSSGGIITRVRPIPMGTGGGGGEGASLGAGGAGGAPAEVADAGPDSPFPPLPSFDAGFPPWPFPDSGFPPFPSFDASFPDSGFSFDASFGFDATSGSNGDSARSRPLELPMP